MAVQTQSLTPARAAASPGPPGIRRAVGAEANGKVILLGEHAVVYGAEAIAAPLPRILRAHLTLRADRRRTLRLAAWGVREATLLADLPAPLAETLRCVLGAFDIGAAGFDLVLTAEVPRSSGLGGSAALAVATARAFARAVGPPKSDQEICDLAFACEKIAHGRPSGIDNWVATYGGLVAFRRAPRELTTLSTPVPLTWVVAHSGAAGDTRTQVEAVRRRRAARPARVDAIFRAIDGLVSAARRALAAGDRVGLGALMNENHAHLVALGVSTGVLDAIVAEARRAGALGAKLTGGGGGGAALCLCAPDGAARVGAALAGRGFAVRALTLAPP